MKKNILLIGVILLTIVSVGVSFAYFVSGINFTGDGATTIGETAELIKVVYDAGTSSLNATDLLPGDTASKTFTVTVTPGSDTNEVTYAIKLNIDTNTFEHCDDTNYDSLSNNCTKGASELAYTLKDNDGNIVANGNLTGKTGEVLLGKDNVTATTETNFSYTLEITFKDTDADQNHNINKTITGEVKVEFAKMTDIEKIIASKTVLTRTDFSNVVTTDTTGTIYSAEDDYGISYYFAGAPTDNYVKFAKKYWRIIRINGDGTIRLIYAGDAETIDALSNKSEVLANGYDDSSTTYTHSNWSVFNESYRDNAYVGFMYGTPDSTTYEETHTNTNSSNMKIYLEEWYASTLADYEGYLDSNAGFCGDRSIVIGTGINDDGTDYAAFYRVSTLKSPTLKCSNPRDLYTTVDSRNGNKALTVPVGLITVDEVMYAGGTQEENKNYYLYTGYDYWTMTPADVYAGGSAAVSGVFTDGSFGFSTVKNGLSVRPVINLKADTIFADGSLGTAEKPYVVVGAE